ncbi:MAG: sigma-54-dependent Fis family transcriptional regulator [Nitrospirae bacterium]|nr:sigma-54-dependent Fis family transcriptional regulator [Nitrospirota bacterium]
MRKVLVQAFTGKYVVEEASRGDEAIEKISEQEFDAVITDLRLPGKDGMEVMDAVKQTKPSTVVIVITAHGTVENAVEAMRQGAYDYVLKPFSISELEIKVEKALHQAQSAADYAYLKETFSKRYGRLIGSGPQIQQVYRLIDKVASGTIPVLIVGESGTGKELVAREIHERSPRKNRAFVPVNCAALSQGILESELFGHEKGSFTGALASRKGRFEVADGGTLFLDEIGDLPLTTQVKLLRFLQEHEVERVGGNKVIQVDVRVVAATHRDLKKAVEDGTFREDLYYRIHGVTINLPPLRERLSDVPELIEHFLQRYNDEMHKRVRLPDDLLDRLMAYTWPGNIRELENIMERAVVLAGEELISEQDLPEEVLSPQRMDSDHAGPIGDSPEITGVTRKIASLEKDLLSKALHEHHWNQSRAAQALGLKRTSLQYKMKKYGLHPPQDG